VTRTASAVASVAPAAAVALTAAVSVLVALVPAPRAFAAEPNPPTGESAATLLARAERAPRSVAYEGVQFVSSWGARGTTSMLVELRHWPAKGTAIRASGGDGQPREVFHGDPGDASGGVAQIGRGPLGLLARNYAVVPDGDGRVAGRPADVVAVLRADQSGQPSSGGSPVAARFWIDRATGLLLRREVYDSRGGTVRASAFVDLSVGTAGVLSHLPPMAPAPASRSVDESQLDRLRGTGWVCPDTLPSGLDLYDARELDDPAGPILHFSYSDGLATVSLFEQRGHLDRGRLGGYRPQRIGDATIYLREDLPLRLTWSAGGRVYTMLADAPDETVRAVVAALPHNRDEDGLLDRVRRGVGRVVSWFNPFG